MKHALAIMLGWMIWATGLVVIYGLHGLHCADRGLPGSALRPSLLAIYLLFAIAQSSWWLRTRRGSFLADAPRMVCSVARISALAAFLAWLATGAPVLFTSACR